MSRQSKAPDERRQELMDAAEQQFLDRGFEAVLVSDIVTKLGVAQGTFYYYFKSKDEVLAAILERKWDCFTGHLQANLAEQGEEPMRKLQTVLGALFRPQSGDQGGLQYFKTPSEAAERWHGMFDHIRIVKLSPIMQQIVREGIGSGVFGPMQHPDEITEILLHGISAFMHQHSPHFSDASYFAKKMSALEELLTRILDIDRGSLNFRMPAERKMP